MAESVLRDEIDIYNMSEKASIAVTKPSKPLELIERKYNYSFSDSIYTRRRLPQTTIESITAIYSKSTIKHFTHNPPVPIDFIYQHPNMRFLSSNFRGRD